ncbi:D-alanyl-D-alanine carboxypeptidase [Ignatzschineria larvae DSM 13226]|uniref:D-alanyl-D-alanine carboxypeptidase n=1 Tax=Ignatzschineria larvae DSM 13226 TaxID=1111732 RepID=A0ABZ3C0Q2_9GAMM|nr:D-alanyl-D-alanine carboxypeptidase [Ignatzschineria larvae]
MKQTLRTLFLLPIILFSLLTIVLAETGFSAYIVDHKSGKSIYEHDVDARRYPASLTKVMTLYIIFEDLSKGKISLDTRIPFSTKAAAQPPSKIGVPAGESISLDLAIKALIVKSANDVALAVAEKIGGSQEGFAKRMNATAKRLGMHSSHFVNPHGLFDEQQYTTARDMVKLGIAIHNHFPKYYPLFQTETFVYNDVVFKSHNRVNKDFPGADGIKTGYIRKSGFNLLTSAKRNNNRVFAVVLGGRTTQLRDDLMISMLEESFNNGYRGRSVREISPAITRDMTVLFTPTKTKPSDKTLLTDSKRKLSQPNTAVVTAPVKPKTAPNLNLAITPELVLQSTPEYSAGDYSFGNEPIKGPIISASNASHAVQVGAFKDYNAARDSARKAYEKVRRGTVQIFNTGEYYRALLSGLDEQEAEKTCNNLRQKSVECFVIIL